VTAVDTLQLFIPLASVSLERGQNSKPIDATAESDRSFFLRVFGLTTRVKLVIVRTVGGGKSALLQALVEELPVGRLPGDIRRWHMHVDKWSWMEGEYYHGASFGKITCRLFENRFLSQRDDDQTVLVIAVQCEDSVLSCDHPEP
jgi:hypothetical protein